MLISADAAGCWIDGSRSQGDADSRAIYLAIDYGWRPVEGLPFVTRVAEIRENNDPDDYILDVIEGKIPVAERATELVERAVTYLDECCPDGYHFIWEAGELSMVSELESLER
jgi:hypothetical protein